MTIRTALRRRTLITAVVGAMLPITAHAADFVAKIGHLESAQQTRNQMLEKVAALVKERTNGEVEFELYPQGQLGNQREMNEGVQLGTLEATVSPAAFLGGFNPAVSILDIPYLLPDDPKKSVELTNGPFGQAVCDSFSAFGVTCLGLWPNGQKSFTSNKPIASIDDFAGQKFRVMDSNILIEQFKSIGASAIPIDFGELYTSLQTGVVDGEENPLDTIKNMKFYEVQKHLLVSNHGAMEDVILFNPAFWESLPEKDRTIISDAFEEVIPDMIAHKTAAVDAALETIKENGVDVKVASDAEKASLREKMYPAARDAYVAKVGDAGQTLIDTYETEYKKVMAE
ncbi:TRAP transporter substrate-binding protein [Rhizobium halophytocola]|uniref:C4-dicarboxylate-binding protein DctP n=1 Tax=Rhizobium halophytocola TaxID=735519 RepID=A0ABS4DVE9_9HYPH|nr:TRAP transporter substrate-binding protein [Rhizobium halophytocola]MBP1849675.1 C4-dicarboxylate-binding protein DctP [Rhizobium halophytocola]